MTPREGPVFDCSVAEYHIQSHRSNTVVFVRCRPQNVQFPEKGLVFDYYVDEQQCLMVPWEDKVPKFQYIPGNGNEFCVVAY